VLHVLVMLAVIIGLPHFMREIPEDTPIPVEIVTVADKTTQKDRPPEPPQPPKPQVKPPEPQQAQPKPTPPKPAPQPPPPAPPQKAEAKPEPAPEKAPEPKAEPIPDKTKKEPPKPEKAAPQQRFAEAKPQKKPQPTRDDFVNSLLKDIAPKKTASDTPTPQPTKTNPTPPPPQPRATSIDDQLTMSEIDFIRRQYIECWNPPAGARDARDLVVSIHVEYNPDGSVRRASIEDTSRMSDPFFRTAAESALRAVLNPRCNPLKVPSKKYDSWKSVTLNFNPREMLGT
jgi:hypothetical protein